MTKYVLDMKTLTNNVPEMQIAGEEFLEISKSKQTISEATSCEEKYEILIHNYLELEKCLVGITIDHKVKYTSDIYIKFSELRLIVDTKIISLLNSGRIYTNTLPESIESCLHSNEKKEEIEKYLKKKYEENYYYRLANELRNHVQHNRLLTHKTSLGLRWIQDRKFLESYSNFWSLGNILEKDEKIKGKMKEIENEVNLLFVIRHYVESISEIHENVRTMMEQKLVESRCCIKSAIDKYKNYNPQFSSVGLFALKRNEAQVLEEHYLTLDHGCWLNNLRNKNIVPLINLHRRYATTQANIGKKK